MAEVAHCPELAGCEVHGHASTFSQDLVGLDLVPVGELRVRGVNWVKVILTVHVAVIERDLKFGVADSCQFPKTFQNIRLVTIVRQNEDIKAADAMDRKQCRNVLWRAAI
ncbi:hypothetical protein KCU71_g54, partial [Aureobasidium melanogenum]